MNTYGVIIIFVTLTISPIFAQDDQTFLGPCPTPTNPVLDETRYAGRWYEIKRYQNTLAAGHCGILEHTLVPRTGGFDVDYVATDLTSNTNATTKLQLRKTAAGPVGNYDVVANDIYQVIGQRVLKTDYYTYSIVWGCYNHATTDTNTQRLSIYSRTNSLTITEIAKVYAALTTAEINTASLKNVEQDNDRCGRSSATTLVLPTILSCIIAMLLTKKF